MDMSFGFFWSQMLENPLMMLAVGLTLGVILVNGWTDAPNAITGVVVTEILSYPKAILLAASFADAPWSRSLVPSMITTRSSGRWVCRHGVRYGSPFFQGSVGCT